MPPSVPTHDDDSVMDVNEKSAIGNGTSTSSVVSTKDKVNVPRDDVSKMLTPATSHKQKFRHFHFELNIYTALFFSLVYFAIPHQYRVIMHIVFTLIAIDATRYYIRKGSMMGVPYSFPLVSLIALIVRPNRYWEELASLSMSSPDGLSFSALVGLPMVFVTDPNRVREILTGEESYGIYAHPNAMWLFGPKNLIYMETQCHKAFRAILTPALFSQGALVQYAREQERVVRRYMNRFAAQNEPIDAQIAFRSMAAASSQESFLGPYLTDDMRDHLEEDILTFTMGFLCFPFPYFNSGLHKSIQAKDRIEATIRAIVPKARQYIEAGNEPRCLMEHWSRAILNIAQERNIDSQQVDCCDDHDMARTVLDFLFAAQDATNSALTYSLDVLDAHRDVLQRMRNEVASSCEGDSDGNVEVWKKMRDADALPFTSKVANQLLHHKPPVPMIPLITKKSCALAGHRLAKKTIVIPSITYSARVSGHSLEFNPDREDLDHLFVQTVTFGAGQHKCPGRRYAESLLKVFLTVLALDYDFERVGHRPEGDQFIYFPTIFPTDCHFMIKAHKKETKACNGVSNVSTA